MDGAGGTEREDLLAASQSHAGRKVFTLQTVPATEAPISHRVTSLDGGAGHPHARIRLTDLPARASRGLLTDERPGRPRLFDTRLPQFAV